MFKKIAILGEIGSGNLGDDLGYMLLKKEIEKHFEYVQIDWITPSRFSVLDYMGYDCVATGVGTLLDKSGGEYVKRLWLVSKRKTPIAILGSGMSDNVHIPDTAEGTKMFDEVINSCAFRYLRGEAPDPVWLLGNKYLGQQQSGMGINMGFAGYTVVDIYKIKSIVEQIKQMQLLQGVPIKLVSAWDNDNPWLGQPDFTVNASPSSFEELGKLKYIVAFRGHLGVVAACCGVNVIAIEYSQKIKQMYAGAGVNVTFLDPTQKDWKNVLEDATTRNADNQQAVTETQKRVQEKIKEFCGRI